MASLTRSVLLATVLLSLGACFASAPPIRTLPPTDQSLWNACQATLGRICRATFEPTWDTCLASKRSDFVYQPSYEARRAFLLSSGCPPTIVNGAARRSREAVMPKPVTPAGTNKVGTPSAPPPPTAPEPPSENPS